MNWINSWRLQAAFAAKLRQPGLGAGQRGSHSYITVVMKHRTLFERSSERSDQPARREILVPASVRIAREKIAAKLQAGRERAAAKAKLNAAREEREVARAALRIAKALDRKAAQREREAAKLDRKAQRLAFQLARRDRLEEQRLLNRARQKEIKKKRGQRKPAKTAKR